MRRTGDEYLDSKEFRKLLASYEEAVNSGQPIFMDAEELAEIADYYQMMGHMDEANDAIDLALKLSPGAIAPLTYKIHEALFNDQPEQAEHYLDMIIDRTEPDYIYDKTEILLWYGKIDEAHDYLQEERRKVPEDELDDFTLDVAAIFHDYRFYNHEALWLKKVRDKDTIAYKEQLAINLFAKERYKESMELYNQLIDADPFSRAYWNMLATLQYMLKDFAGALQSSEYSIAIDPDHQEALIIKANALSELANYDEALVFYRRYRERVPDNELALLQMGNCLTNLHRTDEALAILKEAEQVAPPDSPYLQDILMEQAFIYCDLKDYEQSLAAIERAPEEDCDPVLLNLVKGHVILAQGDISEAATLFQEAVKQSDNPNSTYLRAITSVLENNYVQEAYNLFVMFFKLVPQDFKEGYAYMALCCYELKRYDEFMEYLKKACVVNPYECRTVLAHLFPDNVEPDNYYEYVKNNMTL